MSEDEAERRQREIDAFSAFAQGEAFSSNTFEAPSFLNVTGDSKPESEDESDNEEDTDLSRNLFAEAAKEVDNSGTFNLRTNSSPSSYSTGGAPSLARKHNLEAAAAALADDEKATAPTGDQASAAMPAPQLFQDPSQPLAFQHQQAPKLKQRTPMQTQQVLLPKPLFFGHHLPPKVLSEAREIVQAASKPYPPQVQNLVNAINTYGHGVSLEHEDEETQPSPYVSIFCPKWSEEETPTSSPSVEGSDGAGETKAATTSAASTEDHTEKSAMTRQTADETAESTGKISGTEAQAAEGTISERDLFSMWALGGEEGAGSPSNSSNGSAIDAGSSTTQRDPFLEAISSNMSTNNTNGAIMSDQDLFSQWARGESPRDDGNTRNLGSSIVLHSSGQSAGESTGGSVNFFNASGTLLDVPGGAVEDSDDDEVVVSELKKKVGVNEHLNAALASLEEDNSPNEANHVGGNVEDSTDILARVPQTPDGGRPLSNHELMNGVSPLFGVDDSPLPTEADLGKHETRDAQQRSKEQRRNQAIIENHCPLNIFGPLACPNPAVNPDDNHSWNSRATPPTFDPLVSSNGGVPASAVQGRTGALPSPGPSNQANANTPTASPSSNQNAPGSGSSTPGKPFLAKKTIDSRLRYGWWNVPEEANDSDDAKQHVVNLEGAGDFDPQPLQLQPWEHSASKILVQTKLEPNADKLHKQNRPLSHLHPATSLAQSLPYLSDRPPSYRYLQVDTQAVGFPVLGGEIEPLFCSLAIYHVETVAHGTTSDQNLPPIPDLQRCSKVTETLNFDVVSEPEIEQRCAGALWPYDEQALEGESSGLHGTRCGVFPLPSNLSIHNLYAVLVVHKVISEGSDFEAYLRPGKSPSMNTASSEGSGAKVDLDALRSRAEKASNRQGKFIMPFAFGVAPLLQVFGADIPVVPSSRAVQIPLFRFAAGHGDRQIIDHIMVMLYPRANHRSSGIGGPAPVTNGGTAMLVMRNFGYLGLHSVVNSKSSLARDRLVDFTRELQLRRREDADEEKAPPSAVLEGGTNRDKSLGTEHLHVVPQWLTSFIAEPTVDGGRNIHASFQSDQTCIKSQSPLYAQELAPLSLNPAPTTRTTVSSSGGLKSQRGRGHHPSGEDIEPFFHTSFCNELLCHPRLLHNCPKGNIVVKVELRQMEWRADYNAFFAHLPPGGPAIHNPRRGPSLVQGAFTSCSARCLDPRFLDEFKMKLPLVLDSKDSSKSLSLFFIVYRLSFSSRKKWGKRWRSGKKTGQKVDEISGELAGESDEETASNCHLIQLGCGHLPLRVGSSILPSGNHDIKMIYTARKPKKELSEEGRMTDTSLIVTETSFEGAKGDTDELGGEDGESVGSSHHHGDAASATSASESIAMSEVTDGSRSKQARSKPSVDPMGLQVRVAVHSSIHTENDTLSEFLSERLEEPALDRPVDSDLSTLLGLSREEVIQHVASPLGPNSTDDLPIDRISACPMSDVSSHLLRVLRPLWKLMVSGTTTAQLEWANPAALLPLRVQAFAAMLQLMGSSTLHLSKRGTMQLNATNKWSLVSLSRVIALLFDEEDVFGDLASEPSCKEFLSLSERTPGKRTPTTKVQKGAKERRGRRHVRSNFEFLNKGTSADPQDHLEQMSSDFGEVLSEGSINSESGSTWVSSASSALSEVEAPSTADTSDTTPAPGTGERIAEPTSDSVKIDTLTDFRAALMSGTSGTDKGDQLYESSNGGSRAAIRMINAYSIPNATRRWMTAPASGLATIREDGNDDGNLNSPDLSLASSKQRGPLDSLDTEMVLKASRSSVKQMRVPKLQRSSTTSSASGRDGGDEILLGPFQTADASPKGNLSMFGSVNEGLAVTPFDSPRSSPPRDSPEERAQRSRTLPATDAEIESAGTSFLDTLEKSLGLSGMGTSTDTGEEDEVGQAHHRKTRSRCSIDWTIPNDDLSNFLADSSGEELVHVQEGSANGFDEAMSTLETEMELSTKLPSYVDRLLLLGGNVQAGRRWFPFTYEVVIMQWVALLLEQRALGAETLNDRSSHSPASVDDNVLADAAARTGGVAIASAPVLFELIKQSLGWRIANLFKRNLKATTAPILVTLDDAMLASLEQIIALLTEACLDSRNFDSWETRQTCIDVNDSIVRFLRDMFGFLKPPLVFRLMMVYLSRLMSKDAKKWQDRDSNIGLRCSWEVTKLQLNAVAALVRFPDFVKVNSPQMNNWSDWWFTASPFSTVRFFDDVLAKYQKFQAGSFANMDEGSFGSLNGAGMKPHWLAEILVDICIVGTEHAEQNIQRRSASLLVELFWEQSQQSIKDGSASIVASMYMTLLEKILKRRSYLASCFNAKSQVRQDILRCVVFVLQSAPTGLLRAFWRKLCSRSTGKGNQDNYGGVGYAVFAESTDDNPLSDNQRKLSRNAGDWKQELDIFDAFGLLNLSLATLEYEGSDENADAERSRCDDGPHLAVWQKEFLLTREQETSEKAARRRLQAAHGKEVHSERSEADYSTTSSRRWHSHDSAIVLIRTAQQIVRELRFVLEPSEAAQSLFNPARRKVSAKRRPRQPSFGSTSSRDSRSSAKNGFGFTYMDTVVFVRAATSVYLHSLTLRQSDIVLVKTLTASLEIVKIFGIKIFNEAVGETLQHWMRIVHFHCGSRRAEVRVQASDFLELILRSTWDTFGSFFRIRIPLLAVQTEVMERIVATAAARHYREQRVLGLDIDLFSNSSAEASLAPLWRTLDRLNHQSASQNVAFRSALVRLAQKLKKLFRAYIAAHALSFVSSRARLSDGKENPPDSTRNLEAQTILRASRISIHRVINETAGYSKQFLGLNSTSTQQKTVAHNEAVEDAFLDAADVFSPTELPDHRVAWLRKLAEFHASRQNFAEEATCHYNIHITLQQASRLHGALWSSTPFLPWTDLLSDGFHLDGEGPAGDPDDTSDFGDMYDNDYGQQIDKTNSFRRIFYRHENSVRINGGELEAGTGTYAFYGVTMPSEYNTVSPWISLREMEANMLEEAETAGDLFLKSGIVESSRYAWSLATRHYAEKIIYGKLAHVYERLSRTVVSQVPPIDLGLSEVSVTVPLGRFYRVWFHGGAPDELIGAEFVYRTASNVKLEQFGKELKAVIRCIIPEMTPIHLVLDGRPEEREPQSQTGFRIGSQLEPVKVKVTPLRALVSTSSRIRGLPEWFNDYIDSTFSNQATPSRSTGGPGLRRLDSTRSDSGGYEGSRAEHRDHGRSFSASVFSNTSNVPVGSRRNGCVRGDNNRFKSDAPFEGELVGADKFTFMQPINKDHTRGTRDWLKGTSGDFAEKSLRVTQLQVGQAFPACVSRQPVVHRVVFKQSPLEAAVGSICQWCSILFRTAIATNGQAVLGINYDPGIGIEAAKVVSDCIHSSRVKEMGLYLLKKNTNVEEEEDGDVLQAYDRLGEDEVSKLQMKLARSIVVFMELLHLLIARNRDLLLDVLQERKKNDAGPRPAYPSSLSKVDISHRDSGNSDARSTRSFPTRRGSMGAHEAVSDSRPRLDETAGRSHKRGHSTTSTTWGDDYTTASGYTTDKGRTDSAIGIQSELQRAFISLAKDLHPVILGIMRRDMPRWVKLCCQENYFSNYIYRQTKIPMGEELSFEAVNISSGVSDRPTTIGPAGSSRSQSSVAELPSALPVSARSSNGTRNPGSPGGSLGSGSVMSRGSEAKRSFIPQDRLDRVGYQEHLPVNRMASI